jgi:hypothetical protein
LGGVSHDLTGGYGAAFWASIACSTFSAVAIWKSRLPQRV